MLIMLQVGPPTVTSGSRGLNIKLLFLTELILELKEEMLNLGEIVAWLM